MRNIKIANRTYQGGTVIKVVQGVVVILASLLILFDVIWASDGCSGNTISEVIQKFTDDAFFILIYLWGAFAVHMFVPRKGLKDQITSQSNVNGMLIVTFSGIIIGLVCGHFFEQDNQLLRAGIGLLGGLVAYVAWPQSYKNTGLD